jgi:uncharacterized protein YraI
LKHVVILAALISLVFLAGNSVAEAARAVVAETVNVRSGPSTAHRVTGRLRAGETVNVTHCAPSRRWCHVQSRRTRDGWVRSWYLDPVRGGSNRPGTICFYGRRGHICLSR